MPGTNTPGHFHVWLSFRFVSSAMAMKRTARAIVERKNIHLEEWMDEMRAQHDGLASKDHLNRTAKNVIRQCDPKKYLLSHATIVASVDTYAPRGVKVGRQLNRGVEIDVRWPDFRIKPECKDIVNNNGDAWERSLLLSTYRTFIGAHNYLEHIQLPELSKGFLVDAIARDLGPSVYIDILVATDRKHNQLIADILSGDIDSMSMGCISLFTTCTRCGNVASDDSQLCPCIQYDGKGSEYIAEDGSRQVISELIGHVSVPNSNQFIEASWVRNPAFRGAVRRNVLNPNNQSNVAALTESKLVHDVRSMEPLPDGFWGKAASMRKAQGEEQQAPADDAALESDSFQSQDSPSQEPDAQGGGSQDGGSQGAPEDASNMDSLIDEAQKKLLEMIVNGLSDKLKPKAEDVGSVQAPVDLTSASEGNLVRSSDEFTKTLLKVFPKNPNLVRWASKTHRIVHKGGIAGIHSAGLSARDLIILSWVEDRCRGQKFSNSLYQVAMNIGSINNFPSLNSFLAACKMKAGRDLSADEKRFLIRKGRIASVSKFLDL